MAPQDRSDGGRTYAAARSRWPSRLCRVSDAAMKPRHRGLPGEGTRGLPASGCDCLEGITCRTFYELDADSLRPYRGRVGGRSTRRWMERRWRHLKSQVLLTTVRLGARRRLPPATQDATSGELAAELPAGVSDGAARPLTLASVRTTRLRCVRRRGIVDPGKESSFSWSS
jgi:hypothetical protein